MADYRNGLRRRLLNSLTEGSGGGGAAPLRSVEAWAEQMGAEDGAENQPHPKNPEGSEAVKQLRGYLGAEQQAVAQEWKKSVELIDSALADAAEKSNGHAGQAHEGDSGDDETVAVQTHLSIWVYLAIAALIGVAEFVLMAVVFQIFGADTLETWIAAAGLGFVLPITAHSVGAQFKTRDNPVTLWGALGALIFILGVLAVLRALFLSASSVTSQLVGRDISTGLWTLLFFVMNTAMMIVAAIAAATAPSGEELRRGKIAKLMAKRRNLWEQAKCNAESNMRYFEEIAAAYWRRNLLTRNDLDESAYGGDGISKVAPLGSGELFEEYPHPAWTIPALLRYCRRRDIEVPPTQETSAAAENVAGVL